METQNQTIELTYTVRGPDGKEYGPVTLEQISFWARENRIQAQSEVRRSDMEHWARAGEFIELQTVFPPAVTPMPIRPATNTTAAVAADPATAAKLKSGASWFYWIAGLSLINSIVAFTGSSWRFILGLGITQIFDAIGAEFGGAGHAIVLVLDLLAAGVFILFGVFANKRHLWAFIVGMVLFGLDTIVFLIGTDWLGVGFHAFALFCLFRGFQACRELKA
ncbi:MAG TPA: DUF4339 domain-containing protein [Candidatus Paceibacterota bacterium]|nr:DUF4339 domain-containing protein [Candidatus Paceibacterota bacterium]